MAEVMVTVMPFTGHVTPVLQAVEALRGAGHRVRVYCGSRFAAQAAATGATPVVWRHAPDFDERDLRATFPRAGRPGPRGALANLEHVFVRTAALQAQDLREEWERRPWDVLVADSLSLGGALVSERLGTPWATVSVVPLALPSRDLPPPGLPLAPGRGRLGRARDAALRGAVRVASGRLRRALRQTRAAAGLDPAAVRLDDQWFSPFLVMALGIPGLEPERTDLPAHVHFVGAFPPGGDAALPPGWEPALRARRPVVHVTQGTFGTDPDDLLRPAIAGLGGRSLTVAATTGVVGRDALPFAVPDGVLIAARVPYARLLQLTDVMVTNGGWGGVLAALRHGIPLVVAGRDLDKPAIAGMVARSGAGIDLRTGRPSPEAVAAAVDRVLTEPSFAQHARRLADQLNAHDTAGEVVRLVGQLVADGARVVREASPWAA
ncbi:glycosyltransferase [Motilibacter deserti]|uniref:Glycosyltransferase family 1 protein n=1 Tax=Motilibacter deserti TaxID=2714956 RepID=A0ABX0GRM0_9ACTN|nr:glycosyltransferase [Motilibacter deserti]NHC13504.1 glycosyltransferase family 1 protein [Motilibacter deserti]